MHYAVFSVSLLLLRPKLGSNSQALNYFQIFNFYFALYLRLMYNYVFHNGVKFLSFDLDLGSSFTEKELVSQPNKQQLNVLCHPAVPAAELY